LANHRVSSVLKQKSHKEFIPFAGEYKPSWLRDCTLINAAHPKNTDQKRQFFVQLEKIHKTSSDAAEWIILPFLCHKSSKYRYRRHIRRKPGSRPTGLKKALLPKKGVRAF
jgi:hypothetical protein